MTNALAQNSNISDNSVMNMVNNINLNANPAENIDTSSSSEFSNLMNNVSAKTEATKTNFIDKAIKSNTSSINQKAIQNGSNGATNAKLAKESVKQAARNALQNPKQNQQVAKNNVQNNTNNVAQNTVTAKSQAQNQNTISTSSKVENATNTTSQAKNDTTDTKDLSDINNSSLVEPSPVFSSDNQTVDTSDTATNPTLKDELISIAGIISASTTSTTDDKVDFDELEKSVDDISTVEEVKEILNDIVSKLDDSQINQDYKDEINDILNKISSKNPNLSEIKDDFKNIISSLNEKISTITDDNQNKIDFAQKIDDVIFDKIGKIKSDIFTDDLNKVDFDKLKENIKSISDDIDEIVSSLKNSKGLDNDTISKITDEISQKLDEILKTSEDINVDNSDTTNTTQDTIIADINKLTDDISEKLKAIKENILSTNNKKNDNTFDLNKISTTLSQTFNELKNVDLPIRNKEDLAKISDILKDYSTKTDNSLTNEEASTLQEILDKTATLIEKNPLDIAQKDELNSKITISQDTLNQAETVDFEPLNSSEIKVSTKDDEITLADDTTLNIAQDDDFNFNSENTFDSNNDDNNDYSSDTEVKTSSTLKEEDLQTVEENLEKLASINEMLDDMLTDVQSPFEENTTSLSVSDEVTKIALNETGSLNQSPIQGNIIYDPSSNGGIIMKNIMAKTPTSVSFQEQLTSKLDSSQVLNQITNKITQNTDGSQKLTLVLRPNDLGRLSIELNNNEQGLSTNILAQNEDVRNYIEKNINALRQQLSDAGINVNNIQIKTMGQENTTNYDGNQNFNNQENSENFNNHQQNNQQQKENNERYFANNFGYEFGTTKDFSGVFKNILNYNLN